ncbi:MAG: hypothetical protein GXP55_11190, partial [Deltaproteobacteria bacterium]|nr:hypothetical protein [Deltaproteobacteria bacterium]
MRWDERMISCLCHGAWRIRGGSAALITGVCCALALTGFGAVGAYAQATCTGDAAQCAVQGDAQLGRDFVLGVADVRGQRGVLLRLRRACRRGVAPACTAVGVDAERARRPRLAPAKAAYERGCEIGDGASCGRLGALLTVHPELEAEAPDRPTTLYQRGCELGDAFSCGRQAFERVETDPNGAAPLLEAGCQAGDADACVLFATLHEQSRIEGANPAAAVEACRRACDASSDPGACGHLGALLLSSSGDAAARPALTT